MDVIALRSCLLTLGKRPTLVTNASHGTSGRRTCIKRNLSSTYAISPTTASCAVVAEPVLNLILSFVDLFTRVGILILATLL